MPMPSSGGSNRKSACSRTMRRCAGGTHGAGAHQNRDDRGRAAHAVPDQRPHAAFAIARIGGAQIDFARHVDRDDGAARFGGHHVDGKIVHHAAIDQQMAAFRHRRQDAGKRHARAQRAPQRPAAMDVIAARGQVGGNAEERLRQILDAGVAEMVAQELAHLAAAEQRDQRQGEIGQGLFSTKASRTRSRNSSMPHSMAMPAAMMPPMLVPAT